MPLLALKTYAEWISRSSLKARSSASTTLSLSQEWTCSWLSWSSSLTSLYNLETAGGLDEFIWELSWDTGHLRCGNNFFLTASFSLENENYLIFLYTLAYFLGSVYTVLSNELLTLILVRCYIFLIFKWKLSACFEN